MACRAVLSKCPLPCSLLKTTRQSVERVTYLQLHMTVSGCGYSIPPSEWTTASVVKSGKILDSRRCALRGGTRHLSSLSLHNNHPTLSSILILSTMPPLPANKGNSVQLHHPTLAVGPAVGDSAERSPISQQPVASSFTLLPGLTVSPAAGLPLGHHVWWYQPALQQPMAGHLTGNNIWDTESGMRCPALQVSAPTLECSSVLKKRRKKMNKHKYKKWRKKYRFLRRRHGR